MAMRLRGIRRAGGLEPDRLTLALGVVAAGTFAAVAAGEMGRVWRRGRAPLPAETDALLQAAEVAATQTAEVARAGYKEVPRHENAMFNLLSSFVAGFAVSRWVTRALRGRGRVGPFRNVLLGRRHIHHFVPGIVIAFAAGAAAIVSNDETIEPKLAEPFGIGMGLTLDESALLLELEDVYWTPEGILSVQITLAVTAMLGAVALGLRFLRRGEQLVLEDGAAA